MDVSLPHASIFPSFLRFANMYVCVCVLAQAWGGLSSLNFSCRNSTCYCVNCYNNLASMSSPCDACHGQHCVCGLVRYRPKRGQGPKMNMLGVWH
ncbi:hypothetical protein EDD21DRAFT_370498, partial [Dissophora ornata]